MTPDDALHRALQQALEAEHAAVHLYGVLGARASASARPALLGLVRDAYVVHRERRDRLTAFLLDESATPVAAAAAYALPPPGADAVVNAARELEHSTAQTYAWLVAHTVGQRRRWAVEALTDAAVRALTFRGSPEIFPGAGEYADR